MKKCLFTVLAVVMVLVTVGMPFTAIAATDWTNRVVGESYQQLASLTSVAGEEVASASGAAAYVKAPVGKQAFKVAFKLDFSEKNLAEAEEGYTDNFLSIWLDTKADANSLFTGPIDTTDFNAIGGSFKVTRQHLQEVTSEGSSIDDFGGNTVNTINSVGYVQMYLEVTTVENSSTVTLSAVSDADAEMASVFFTADSSEEELYLCFGLYGSVRFELFDIMVESSDIDGATGSRNEFVHNSAYLTDGTLAPLLEGTVISSMNDDYDVISWGTAAAYTGVLGNQAFEVSFDLVWKSTTNDRNNAGTNYNALGIYLSDTNEFSSAVSESTCLPLSNWFEITDRHLEIKSLTDGNTSTNGFQDFGGNYTVLGDDVTHHVVMKLENGKLTLTMLGKTWTLNYASLADGNKYLGFALQGASGLSFAIHNFDLISSDLETAADRTAGLEFATDYVVGDGAASYFGYASNGDHTALRFGFCVQVAGVKTNGYVADLTGAEIVLDGTKYTVTEMGGIISNDPDANLTVEGAEADGVRTLKIPAQKVMQVTEDTAYYAIGVRGIPSASAALTAPITCRTYITYTNADGNAITIYGDCITRTVQQYIDATTAVSGS